MGIPQILLFRSNFGGGGNLSSLSPAHDEVLALNAWIGGDGIRYSSVSSFDGSVPDGWDEIIVLGIG